VLRRFSATLLLTLVAAGSLAPAAALGQANPFTPLPPSAGATETTETQGTTEPADEGLKRWQELLLFAGGIALILGIGWAILHDAQRHAPVEDDREYYGGTPHGGSVAARRKAANRKKAKAQKAARRKQR